MLKKPLIIASTAALIATATFPPGQGRRPDLRRPGRRRARRDHRPRVDGRHGAGVGAAIGAVAGAASSASYRWLLRTARDYGYAAPAPVYNAPVYSGPAYGYGYGYAAPVYPAATIVYSSGPTYPLRAIATTTIATTAIAANRYY
jgi:hypothetical protein